MMKKGTITRIIVNGVLLAAIIALGITLFQSKPQTKEAVPETENTEELAEAEEEPSVDADTNDVQANLEESAETSDEDSEPSVTEEETPVETEETTDNPDNETSSEEETQSTSASVLPQVNFTEASLMQWPVEGELMMDYSMENTTYFSTLDQYKLNPAIVVKAVVGAPVKAASNGTITSIADTAKTGTTLTMDMGNGYQSVYGQLTDLLVEEGQTVKEGTILGYIAEPSKYYSIEGSSLYFAMTKDDQPIDPITYLP
ncbi:Membrane-bound metallopeptidase [Blautia hydrogenotrophica]|uniref:M23 family metallopeptidase n=1 Tax=Blautia hydrogenotrophica TaxID=53443 RepID=UPI0006BFF76C|nr:M23 family metallopeptidase [Blautia hydrogenotrophica]CUM87323.1 Membrane-bound metallopeptidase [Blautia hydrogenotrophica]SCH24549.1 Membrane-bound metallopeptidase [uncultured Blautia sp.]